MNEERAAELAAAVKTGVVWLDEELPGWRDRINPSTLDISDPAFCVLGQAAVPDKPAAPDWWREDLYSTWADKAGYSRYQASELLFPGDKRGFVGDSPEEDALLRELWLAELATVPADDDRA